MFDYIKRIEKNSLLEKAFSYVLINNKSGNLPYHNNKHIIGVFNLALRLAEEYNLPENTIVEIGVACLFHDINHSGGKLQDYDNIVLAINEFYKFWENKSLDYPDINISNIISMMKKTEFPKKSEPTNIQQKIIMDADLLQAFDDDWFIYAVVGLAKERKVTIAQALEDQTNFINNISFYTEEANIIHNNIKSEYIKYLEYLKTVFK